MFFLSQFGIQPVFFVEPPHGEVLETLLQAEIQDTPRINFDGDTSSDSGSDDGNEIKGFPYLKQPLTLKTDIGGMVTNSNTLSSVIVSADIPNFYLPNHRLNAQPRLIYLSVVFTQTSVIVPAGFEVFVPIDDPDRFSIYTEDPYKLLAIVESDKTPVFVDADIDVDDTGTTLNEGVHLYTGPEKFHMFLELKELTLKNTNH